MDKASDPSNAMCQAMAELWRMPPTGSDDLQASPAFLRLCDACRDGYPNLGGNGLKFALSTALRALGLPREFQVGAEHLASVVENAVDGLHTALCATQTQRLHLAPLDLAAELPDLAFGAARVRRFTADELCMAVDATRLQRMLQSADFDADRFSEFHWLVVAENVLLDRSPEKRSLPSLDFSQDLGKVEPHKGQFPSPLEDALFFILLAPWETWSCMPDVDWRGFRIPWVYSANHDIFVRPNTPPSPDTLNWDLCIFGDEDGGTCEVYRPLELPLKDEAKSELLVWDQSRWAIIEEAKASVLFETPIAHFFVRAFLAEGVDEFLAHITTIEAALGLQADYQKNSRIAPDRHKQMGATKKIRGRIAGLLRDRRVADDYKKLFDVRSAYLHGRKMAAISTKERVLARSLARRVVEALILKTKTRQVSSREDFLDGMLDQGASMI